MRILGRWLLVLAVAGAGCDAGGGGDGGRVSLALTGQFFPGELTSLDIFIYPGDAAECRPEDGSLSQEPSSFIDSRTAIPLDAPDSITFTLPPNDDYIVYVQAGLRDGTGPLDVVAQGCAAVNLEYQATIEIDLHRLDTCGDGDLDFREMCDPTDPETRGGCTADCQTTSGWINDYMAYQNYRQNRPVAAGRDGTLMVSWATDNSPLWTPTAWVDVTGAASNPFRAHPGSIRAESVSVDVRGNRALLTFNLGEGFLTARDDMIIAWNDREPLEDVQVGLTTDELVTASFVGDDEIVALSLGQGVMTLRSILFQDVAGTLSLVVGETGYPVDESGDPAVAADIAAGEDNFVVVWADVNDEIWARLYSSIESGAATVPLCPLGGCSRPAVASLGGVSGEYLAVYLNDDEAVVGRLIDLTGQASNEFEISATDGCRDPAVAPLNDEEHEFVVAWSRAGEVYARVVAGAGEFSALAQGRSTTEEPLMVTAGDGRGYGQPAVATAFRTPQASTAIVFYTDEQGMEDVPGGSDSDIGYRLIRVARPPSGP